MRQTAGASGAGGVELHPMGGNGLDARRAFAQFVAGDDRGVLVLDERRHVIQVNENARRMLDFTLALPVPIASVVPDMNVGFAVGDAIHDRRALRHESFLPGPDRILSFGIVPITDRSGHISHAVLTVEDVTRLRHLETVRRDFVANVSHELRTPIASINLLVETLQNGGLDDREAAKHFLQRIQVETQSMNRLVEELLELSRLESGRLGLNPEPLAVALVVHEVRSRLALTAHDSNVELEADIQQDLPDALADHFALEQVLMNLVHNGIKFTPKGGRVTVRARRHGPSVEVEIVDTGVGMSADDAARVFERFYKVDKSRNRDSGTGLGLAIARHLLELQGSRLKVVSEVGRGSRFSFALPILE